MLRGAGIVALFVLAACNQSSPAPRVSPSVPAAQASWNQDLTFGGEVTGHMSAIVPNAPTQISACTGAKPRAGQTWADEFYGFIDSSGSTWGVTFVINNYAGPGTYTGQAVQVQVHNDGNTRVWENLGADAVTFTGVAHGDTNPYVGLITDPVSVVTAEIRYR